MRLTRCRKDEKERRRAELMTDENKAAYAVGHARPLEETHPHLRTFAEFLDDFNKETERGAALSSTAYIDHLLERTLFAFLIPNASGAALTTGFSAPLGTFLSQNRGLGAVRNVVGIVLAQAPRI